MLEKHFRVEVELGTALAEWTAFLFGLVLLWRVLAAERADEEPWIPLDRVRDLDRILGAIVQRHSTIRVAGEKQSGQGGQAGLYPLQPLAVTDRILADGARPLEHLHEYRLLETLLSHLERVFSRGELLERGWDAPDHRLERTIDSHIKSLRNKLREIDPEANPICTHRGMGYSLVPGA